MFKKKFEKCSVDGCSRPYGAGGYCRLHYGRVKTRGTAGGVELERRPGRGCSVDGCDGKHYAKGYCGTHYKRLLKQGEPGGLIAVKAIPGRVCAVAGCEKEHSSHGYCSLHAARIKRTGSPGQAEIMFRAPRGEGTIHSSGYRAFKRPDHPNAYKNGYLFEHTIVMTEMLGRPLRKHENVHHKNGDKLDNRPENLELWSKAQPAGQRVSDKLHFAVEMLSQYADDIIVWPGHLHKFQSLLASSMPIICEE